MKRILSIFTVATVVMLVMVACNRNSGADTKGLSYADTVGLAQFQNWKMQNERLDPNTIYKPAVIRTKTVKSNSGNYGSGSMNSVSQNNAKTAPEKKGWSKAAKGAAIGGGSGAVLGAVINKKNRVAGGVIGGVVGAGIGYVLGRSKDKKDGRY